MSVFLLAVADDAMMHARRSYALQTAGKSAEAEQELREAIRLDPQNPLFHSALSGLLMQVRRPDEAILELETALDGKPPEAALQKLSERLRESMLARGAELAQQESFRSGLALSQRAALRFPQSAPVLQMLGFFQSKERLNVDAVATYRRALALAAGNVEMQVGLAIAQAAAGMEVEAVQALETSIRAHPQESRFPQALAGLLLARPSVSPADIARARSLLSTALHTNPNLAESHYQLGLLDAKAGGLPSALLHLETAARLDPADGRVHFALARLYRQQNRTEEAQRELELFSRSRLAAHNQ